ncbi:glycosyltransferase [Microbacterium yannicii]|uniref:glycosyltransferase n=1 Tax=Microbacterium yannicii TaxID=671622 RepID=UPI0002E5583F|nr:glycosyltransferase [Microbacterium yannicii]
MKQPRVAVIVRYGLNPSSWAVRYDRGEVADRTPYAYHLAEPEVLLEWSDDRPEGPLARWWRMTVKRILGFDFVHVWRNRAVIARADAVWTHTEREHLAVALLKVLNSRAYRAASIAQSVWLWDLWPELSGLRRSFFRRLLQRHAVEIVLSRENRDDARREAPGRSVLRVPFGTHFADAGTDGERRPRVVVVGNDRHRDWDLMAATAHALPDVDIDVISLASEVHALDWPPNVTVRSLRQAELLRTLYRSSTVVALPLRPNRHASGCTVAIEALSAGVPVVATDVGGIDEYLEGSTAGALVPAGDVDGFTRAIASRARHYIPEDTGLPGMRGLSEHDYITRLVWITRSVLTSTPIPDAVEEFAAMASVDDQEHVA